MASDQVMTASQRRLEVLRAIVEDYVETREPVGSRAVVERHSLRVSPATVRNDMAVLEEEGYIAQPHTSAGRVPTDQGYRLFVDELATIKPLSGPQRRALEHFLGGAVDLDDVVVRAGRLLAQLTGQVAVVQYPSLHRSGMRHLELVPTGANRLLIVIITDTGRVEQRTIEVESRVPDELALLRLRTAFNVAAAGKRGALLPHAFSDVVASVDGELVPLAQAVADVLTRTLAQEGEERLVMAGAANLAQVDMRFEHALRPVLEALEEQVVLLSLITEMAADTGSVSVRIGHETNLDALHDASVVTAGYGNPENAVATITSIGPTRMDYPATIAAVRAVARYLSRIVAT